MSYFRWWASLVGLLLVSDPATAAELHLRFLDVGQGDAALLSHEGKHVLVDTGPSDAIVDQLRGLGVHALELLVVSHNHDDHMGGADAVIAALPVRRYLDNALPAKTKIQAVVLDLLDHRQVAYEKPAGTIQLGDLVLRILPPPDDVGGDPQNNASVGLLVEHGKFKALLTGDSEVEEINAWLKAGAIPDVDVLKAAHHGSRNGVTPLWLHQSMPEVVVISVGVKNGYGHPEAAALKYYEAGGRRVLRTDLHGAVLVTVQSDGAYAAVPQRSSLPASVAARPDRARRCCTICRKGKPCGDTCIAAGRTCSKPVGCACEASAAPPPSGVCTADERHCCDEKGSLVLPGGCQPSYPDNVEPGITRGPDGRCVAIPCHLK